MTVLVVNTGSSSVRLAAFAADDDLHPLAQVNYSDATASPAPRLAAFVSEHGIDNVELVGHRVVHGGEQFSRPVMVDAAVEAAIERLAPLAPLHNPAALAWMRACRERFADAPQVAVFDTAFYSTLPAAARTYALPRALARAHGIRRYGFHGIAHEAMWRQWSAARPQKRGHARVISLQLGAGCSITATVAGRAVDTSMGFSPLEGLVMATRCGDLDPGIVMFLERAEGLGAQPLEHLLNHASGLHGISGASGDMRELLASTDADAALAVEVYCYRARKYIGAYVAALGGVDAILFGGGVGEHAPEIRARILAGLDVFGIAVDAAANRAAIGTAARIDAPGAVEVWVMPVDEAHAIARAALAVAGADTTKE